MDMDISEPKLLPYITPNIKTPFDIKYFWSNQTVEYLKSSLLDHQARTEILLECSKLNFPCVKYLIDCYLDGTYNWDEKIYCEFFTWAIPFNYILFQCHEHIILYLLNICVEKNFTHVLIHEGHHKTCSIHYLSCCRNIIIVNRVLDICIENGLDICCETESGYRVIDYLCLRETCQPIKRIIDFYVERDLIFDNCPLVRTLRQRLEANRKPNVSTIMTMYFDELPRAEFTSA